MGEQRDVLTEFAPERIWLQVDTDGDENDRREPIKRENWGDLTWCYDSIGGQEVVYVRADLADAQLQSEKARADAAEAELRASLEFVSRFTSGNNVPRDVRHLAVQAGPTIAQEATFLRDQINDAMNGANDQVQP